MTMLTTEETNKKQRVYDQNKQSEMRKFCFTFIIFLNFPVFISLKFSFKNILNSL